MNEVEKVLHEINAKLDCIIELLKPIHSHAEFVGEMKETFNISKFRKLSGIIEMFSPKHQMIRDDGLDLD